MLDPGYVEVFELTLNEIAKPIRDRVSTTEMYYRSLASTVTWADCT